MTRSCTLSLLGFCMIPWFAGCGGELDSAEMGPLGADPFEVAAQTQDLVGGTSTSLRPEVGRYFNGSGGSCTATLIHPRYILTAAHCLNYPQYDDVTVRAGARFVTGSRTYNADRIHSFAYRRYEYTSSGDRTTDLALIRLATAVPTSVATPAVIAARPPRNNERVTTFGFGCTQRSPQSGGGFKQYLEFDYPNATTALCPGDSGGPVFLGNRTANGPIWGVNSDYTGSGSFNTWTDIFADVTYYKGQIEAIIRQWEGSNLEYDFDRPGSDYQSFWVFSNNVNDCREACETDSNCHAFTYRKAGVSSTYGYCWLKDRTPGMRAKTGYISGTAGKMNKGLGFTGGFTSFTASPARPDSCAQACGTNTSCQSWDYRVTGGVATCTLSSLQKTPTSCSGCYSGFKRPARELNTDRWGNDYTSVTTTSVTTCETYCAQSSLCKAWTHVASSSRCFLKDAEGAPSSYTGATSGKKRGLEVNTDRPGSDYASFTPATPSPEVCQASCANNTSCKAWTYTPPTSDGNPRCHLKNSIPGAYSTTRMVSGWQFNWFGSTLWTDDPPNTDRLGGDFSSFVPWPASSATCKSSCQNNSQCRAWTFIPSKEGQSARCYLKNSIPTARNTTNMVSGLKGTEFLRE